MKLRKKWRFITGFLILGGIAITIFLINAGYYLLIVEKPKKIRCHYRTKPWCRKNSKRGPIVERWLCR